MIFSKGKLCALLIVLSILGTVGPVLQAEPGRPSDPTDYVLIELIFGLQGALLGGGAGFYATYWALSIVQPCPTAQPERHSCELGTSLISLIYGPSLGIPPGATFFGVALAGAIAGVQGNLLFAFLGSVAGTLAGSALVSNWALEPTDFSLVVNPVTMAALGATIGFNIGATIGATKHSARTYRLTLLEARF